MFLYLSVLGILLNHVHSYVLLQVSKDEQNRSNVDALIHKIVPSDQYDKIAAKIARKQFPSYPSRVEQPDGPLSQPTFKSQDENPEELPESDNIIMKTIKTLFEQKPIVKTKKFQIEPEVINFRSNKPSLLYEISADTFVDAIKDILSSKQVRHYVEEIAKRAAAVYRTMKDS